MSARPEAMTTTRTAPMLEITGLEVRYPGRERPALTELGLMVSGGQCLAVIGRSGAGKSSLLHALGGLLKPATSLCAGRIRLAGEELLPAMDFRADRDSPAHRTAVKELGARLAARRGTGLMTIFQEPRAALTPTMSIREQLRECLALSGSPRSPEAVLAEVELAPRVLSARPEELSVGMCQRVQIAFALALGSRVVLADEPLARIDPRGRGIVARLLLKLVAAGSGLILVTHDPELVERCADEVLAIHGGRVIERGAKSTVMDRERPHHPLLLAFRKAHDSLRREGAAWTARGPGAGEGSEATSPGGGHEGSGCPLAADCWACEPDCRSGLVSERGLDDGRALFCLRDDLDTGALAASPRVSSHPLESRVGAEPLLSAEVVSRRYRVGGWWRRREIIGIEDATLRLRRGEVLALVGESGGGKTTLANMLTGLLAPDSGRVELDAGEHARAMPRLGGEARRRLAGRLQLVFQEADQALDPAWSVLDSVAEAYQLNWRGVSTEVARGLAAELLGELWLETELIRRPPARLSGGERKRAGLARALAALGRGLRPETPTRPPILVLDEPLSGLDPVVQGQTLQVLLAARATLGLSLVLISHDLPMALALSDTVAVVYGGRIVELAATGSELRHPFSRRLLDPWRAPEIPVRPAPASAPCVYFASCDRPDKGPDCRALPAVQPEGVRVACVLAEAPPDDRSEGPEAARDLPARDRPPG